MIATFAVNVLPLCTAAGPSIVTSSAVLSFPSETGTVPHVDIDGEAVGDSSALAVGSSEGRCGGDPVQATTVRTHVITAVIRTATTLMALRRNASECRSVLADRPAAFGSTTIGNFGLCCVILSASV